MEPLLFLPSTATSHTAQALHRLRINKAPCSQRCSSLSCQHTSPQSCLAVTCFNQQSTLMYLWSPQPHFSHPPSQLESFLPTHLHPTVKPPSFLPSYLYASSYQQTHTAQSPHPPPTSNLTTEKLLECSVPPRWWQSGLVSSSQAGTGAPEAQNEG